MRWLLLILTPFLISAFSLTDWKANLDTTRADLLTQARINVGETEPAEDTELEFDIATGAISVTGTAVTLGHFRDLGDEFQICVDVNANSLGASVIRSCWTYDREEIEK